MKSACRKAAVGLFLVCLAGCSHKDKNVVPLVAEAPVLPMSAMSQPPAVPDIPPPPAPRAVLGTQETAKELPPPPEHPHRTTHRKPKPTTPEEPGETAQTQTPATQPEQQAALSAQPSDMSPIGQLSAANDNSGTPDRHTINDIIAATENGLNGVKRALSPDEQKTVIQIRTFLIKAKDALKVDDLTGAHTLATKARLLFDELNKS